MNIPNKSDFMIKLNSYPISTNQSRADHPHPQKYNMAHRQAILIGRLWQSSGAAHANGYSHSLSIVLIFQLQCQIIKNLGADI